ncbi:MAG: carboxy terminal-processing peptidase [Pseudomonadota bacterium]
MRPFSLAGKLAAPVLAALLGLQATYLAAKPEPIPYSDSQQETIAEIIEALEERHYAKAVYDDAMSSEHLDNYVEKLDGGKMFFLASDLKEFETYRKRQDDLLRRGNLEPGYLIFQRFHERLEARLEEVISTLPETFESMDFTVDEEYQLDFEQRSWASSEEALDERWRKRLKNQALGLRLADKPDEEVAPTLLKRYKNQLNRVRQYNSQDVFQIYANALTELYDPHTNYFSPRRSENFNINMSLSLEGIGAVLQLEDEYTKVSRLVPAGPADKQGDLQPSDRIIGVGQGDGGKVENVIGWRLDEVVQLIRGPKGSTVRLEVIPAKSKAGDKRKVITIVRNEVKLEEQSAQKRIIDVPDGDDSVRVGVIDIPAFYIDFDAMRRGEKDYKSTTRDVRRLLEELQSEGVDGIVIDLRNNGGGSLQEANELTGLFIEYGPTVQIRHSSRRVYRDGKRMRGNYYEGPLVVMINRLSASASEIFAGAIQDYERGIIVGDRSFGKGTVQTMVPLTEGQLKITESKFYRISGDSTQHRGVVPDVAFPSLYDPDEIGESSLDHALPWDRIHPRRHRRYEDYSKVIPRVTERYQERSVKDPDFVYLEAQIALAEEARELTTVSLNEAARIAAREDRETRALAIENKRRAAKGEPLLEDWEEESVDEALGDVMGGSASREDTADESEEDDEPDVLLREAGAILVDAMDLKKQAFAISMEKRG